MKYLFLTSKGSDKVAAVEERFPDRDLIAVKTDTYVEQPFGLNQTCYYCENRTSQLIGTLGVQILYDERPIISIESGIAVEPEDYWDYIELDSQYYDIACVTVRIGRNSTTYWSDKVYIPKKYNHCLELACDRGFEKNTFGSVLQEKYGINAKSWQGELTGVSRKDQLMTALNQIELP